MTGLNGESTDPPLPQQQIVMPRQFQDRPGHINDLAGLLGPLTSHYVCLRQLGNLAAVDPRDGKTLWVRRDLPEGCVVFGDDRYVFLIRPHRDEALVLRASNGEFMGMRKMPPIADERASDSCLAILGRKILLWQPQSGGCVLSLFDPLDGHQQWQGGKFAAGTLVRLINEKAVGLMEPGGRFVLYSLPDGRTIADLKLEAEPALRDLILLESGDKYFLLTSDSEPEDVVRRPGFPRQGGVSRQGNEVTSIIAHLSVQAGP